MKRLGESIAVAFIGGFWLWAPVWIVGQGVIGGWGTAANHAGGPGWILGSFAISVAIIYVFVAGNPESDTPSRPATRHRDIDTRGP